MTDLQEALDNASAYNIAVDKHRTDILEQPDELIRQSIAAMTKLRDSHEVQRVEVEANHRTRIDQLRAHYDAEKSVINRSINELETQLSELRRRWGMICDEENAALDEEKSQWVKRDRAQRKLIASENRMIEDLRT